MVVINVPLGPSVTLLIFFNWDIKHQNKQKNTDQDPQSFALCLIMNAFKWNADNNRRSIFSIIIIGPRREKTCLWGV